MRIAVIAPAVEAANARLQPTRTILDMAQQLKSQSHDVIVISNGPRAQPRGDDVDGLPVLRVRSVSVLRRRLHHELFSLIASEAPDLLMWHVSAWALSHWRLPRVLARRTVAVVTSPAHAPREIVRLAPWKLASNPDLVAMHLAGALAPPQLVRRAFARGGLRGVITLSEATRRLLVAKGAPADNTRVVSPMVSRAWLHSSLDEEALKGQRVELGLAPDDLVVAYTGSPAPIRGIYPLLDAVSGLTATIPKLRLLILSRRRPGEWKREFARLQRRLAEESDETVRLVDGFLSQPDLIRSLLASDVIALPFELLPSDVPLSILEAMALGRPVITTATASIPELLAGDRGFLAQPASVESLTEQLRRATADPALARLRAARAKAFVSEHHTEAAMATALRQAVEAFSGEIR